MAGGCADCRRYRGQFHAQPVVNLRKDAGGSGSGALDGVHTDGGDAAAPAFGLAEFFPGQPGSVRGSGSFRVGAVLRAGEFGGAGNRRSDCVHAGQSDLSGGLYAAQRAAGHRPAVPFCGGQGLAGGNAGPCRSRGRRAAVAVARRLAVSGRLAGAVAGSGGAGISAGGVDDVAQRHAGRPGRAAGRRGRAGIGLCDLGYGALGARRGRRPAGSFDNPCRLICADGGSGRQRGAAGGNEHDGGADCLCRHCGRQRAGASDCDSGGD